MCTIRTNLKFWLGIWTFPGQCTTYWKYSSRIFRIRQEVIKMNIYPKWYSDVSRKFLIEERKRKMQRKLTFTPKSNGWWNGKTKAEQIRELQETCHFLIVFWSKRKLLIQIGSANSTPCFIVWSLKPDQKGIKIRQQNQLE